MRNIRDGEFYASTALPAAAANSNTAGFYVGTLGITAESVRLRATIPATPDLVDTKTITLTPVDSADGETYVAIEGLEPLVITADGSGGAAADRTWPLPTSTRAYVAVNRAVESAGGDNTDIETVAELLF